MDLQLAFEQKTENPVHPSAGFSRVALICGKRGSGKSYTMGVIAEELAKQDRFLIILVDPMGVFWSMGLPTGDGVPPPVNIVVPGDPAERYSKPALSRMKELGVQFSRITLNPSALSAQAWCDLFDLSMSEPLGICLYRAVRACQRKGGGDEETNGQEPAPSASPSVGSGGTSGQTLSPPKREESPESEDSQSTIHNSQFTIRALMREVETDGQAADRTREALLNRLDMADAWGLFAEDHGLGDGLKPDHINVLDLSIIDPGLHGLRNMLVALLCRDLFARRIRARREEELGLIDLQRRVWLLIDEAHQFVPTGRASIAKDTLIRWVKEGRQPGLSLVAISQQPGAIDADLLSQCDLLIIHKLTAQEDLTAISRLGQSYIQGDLKVYLKRLREPGEVVIVDDHEERLWMGKVRERETRHAGGELPLSEQKSRGRGDKERGRQGDH